MTTQSSTALPAVQSAIRFGEGWHDEERHDVQPYRWTSGRSVHRVSIPEGTGAPWLRVTAAHTHAGEQRTLSVSVNGRPAGSGTVRDCFSDLLFPCPGSGDVEVVFHVDRTFVPPGDARELGVMVRSVDVIDLAVPESAIPGEGWYGAEDHEYFAYRWMAGRAKVVVPASLRKRGRFLAFPLCSEIDGGGQVLEVRAAGVLLAQVPLLFSWHVYDITIADAGLPGTPLELTLSLNQLVPERVRGSDPRELGARVGAFEVHDDARRHQLAATLQRALIAWDTSAHARPPLADLPSDGPGWYWWEAKDLVPYRWMGRRAAVAVTAAHRAGSRYLHVPLYSEFGNLRQVVTVTIGGQEAGAFALLNRWFDFHFELPPDTGADIEVVFSVNVLVPPAFCAGDWRELGVRVGRLGFHSDEAEFDRARWAYENALRNKRELEAGASVLESFPTGLGVDLYGKCNIKPACVYCPWDEMKGLEGAATTARMDEETFAGYGRFFDGAGTLVNCAFGEPLLHPRFAELLDFFAARNKTVELSSNGQAFTPATVRALAGRRVKLFVSLDAASPEVYARLRNDRWHEIIAGLSALREARRRSNGLPTLNMVFMPMRANLHDLQGFVKLCRMVGADTLMLRPLQLENWREPVVRGGYRYDYATEQLGPEELEPVFEACERWCREHEVTLVKQFDFGKTEPEQRHMGEEGRRP